MNFCQLLWYLILCYIYNAKSTLHSICDRKRLWNRWLIYFQISKIYQVYFRADNLFDCGVQSFVLLLTLMQFYVALNAIPWLLMETIVFWAMVEAKKCWMKWIEHVRNMVKVSCLSFHHWIIDPLYKVIYPYEARQLIFQIVDLGIFIYTVDIPFIIN